MFSSQHRRWATIGNPDKQGLSYRDVKELLAERGAEVDRVTVYRWVQRFTPVPVAVCRFLSAIVR